MNMMFKIIFVIYLITVASSSIVKWIPNKSFNLPINFQNGKLPCSKQTVVFPETIQEAVQIENDTSVREFILPIDGEITITSGFIAFSEDDEDQCTEGNTYYIENSIASWAQPDVWSSEKFNDATPDAERIPCYDDTVVFDDNAQFTLFLPDVSQYVKTIKIGDENLSLGELINRVYHSPNPSQIFLLSAENDEINIGYQKNSCRQKRGCPCQEYGLEINCRLKFCRKANCVNPIKPIGHCCEICGGHVIVDTDQTFDMMSFKEYVDKIIENYGSDKLEYHIGVIPHTGLDNKDIGSRKVQVVVVDKGEYTGTSALVANEIYHNLKSGAEKHLFLSGSSLETAEDGWKISISMFFMVVLVMGAIYLYYYRAPGRWAPNISIDLLRIPNLTRFQRTDSVVTLTRRDSTVSAASGTAFRNPLYDSKRGRVQLAEPVETVREE